MPRLAWLDRPPIERGGREISSPLPVREERERRGKKRPRFRKRKTTSWKRGLHVSHGVTTTSNERGIPGRHARKRREKEKKHHDHDAPTFGSREISLCLSRSFYLHVNRVIVQVRERMRNKRKEKFALDCYIIVPFTRFPGSFFLKEKQHWLADPPPPPPSIRFDRLRRR